MFKKKNAIPKTLLAFGFGDPLGFDSDSYALKGNVTKRQVSLLHDDGDQSHCFIYTCWWLISLRTGPGVFKEPLNR